MKLQSADTASGDEPLRFADTFGAARSYGPQWKSITPLGKVINFMVDVVNTFTMMIGAGILDRYPALKLIVLESGVGWLPWWLDKMDHWNEARLAGPSIELPPSAYVARQIWISGDPDERSFATVSQLAPSNRLIWASDFPHSDAKYPGVVDELREHTVEMAEEPIQSYLGIRCNGALCSGER